MVTLRQYSSGAGAALFSLFSRANLRSFAFVWIPVFLMSAFLGLCCVVLPWWLNVAMAMAVVYAALLWVAPWAGFGAYVLIAIIAPDFKLADIATVGTMGLFVLRLWMHRHAIQPLPRRVFWPLLSFGALALMSTCLAIFYFHNPVPNIYRDGRVFLYWLWIPLLWQMMAGKADGVVKLVRVMLGIAFAIALLAIFQALTGVQVVTVGLVAALDPSGGVAGEGGITRVQMPGFVFVSWAIIWLTLQIIYKRVNPFIGAGAMLVLALALYVNFGRGAWAWTFIGILIPVFFIGSGRAAKLLMFLVVAGALVGGGLAAFKPSVLDNIAHRMGSVKDEGGKKTSYGFREQENQDARAKLTQTPLLGVGMGGEYRAWIPELRRFFDHVRYIHNSYFFIAVKIGIPGLLCMLLLFWRAWSGGRQGLATVPEQNRVALLSCLSFVPISMGLNITQPEFMSTYGVLLYSMVLLVLMNCFPALAPAVKRVRWKG